MRSAKLIFTIVFVLTLTSGVAAGILFSRLPSRTTTSAFPAPAQVSPLQAELNLRPDQQKQMQDIWEGVRGTVDGCFAQGQDIQKQRDQALVAILTDEQKARFQKIDAEYKNRFDALKKDREDAFRAAVQKTDALLDETQRKKFHELIDQRVGPLAPANLPGMPEGSGDGGKGK